MVRSFAARAPDSKIAGEATELARRDCPPALFNHCMRTFFFAEALSAEGLRFDREVVYIAAILHDLGLVERHDRGERFEVDGAEAAHDFLVERYYPSEKASLVWDAIALHTSPSIAMHQVPEVRLVHIGAGADALGIGIGDLDPGFVRELIEELPRLDFPDQFLQLLIDHVTKKPDVACGTWLSDVGRDHVAGFPCPSVANALHSNPLDTKA